MRKSFSLTRQGILQLLLLACCQAQAENILDVIVPKSPGVPDFKLMLDFCLVADLNGKILADYPGVLCAFHPNGLLISSDYKNIKAYDKFLNVVWKLDIGAHHDLNLDAQGNIMFISREKVDFKNRQDVCFDVVYKIDGAGKIISEWHFKDHFVDLMKKLKMKIKFSPAIDWGSDFKWGCTSQAQQLNSIVEWYEKPNDKEPTGLFISDWDNKFVALYDYRAKKFTWLKNNVHVGGQHSIRISKGVLFFLENGNSKRPYSSLAGYDIQTKKKVFEYHQKIKTDFYCEDMGYLEPILDDKLLIVEKRLGNKNSRNKKTSGRITLIDYHKNLLWQSEVSASGIKPFNDPTLYRALKIDETLFNKFNLQ